jgi:pyruvate dehydrogenase E1 component beta subunit
MSSTHRATYTEALREAIDEEMDRDERTFVMGEDVVAGTFGVTTGLTSKYGAHRVRNTPISEAGYVGAGLGAAIAGARPIVEIQFASLVYLAMDQLVNQIAKLRYMTGGQLQAPITIRAAVAMGMGAGAQHSDTPHAMVAHAPGLKIALPASPRDAKGLLKSAIRDDDPVIVFESAALGSTRGDVPDDAELIPFGEARVVTEGEDVTIVALGSALPHAADAVEMLRLEGISAELIDPRTIVPMDWDTVLASVTRTGRLVVVDDANPTCSFASEIAATVGEMAFPALRAPVVRVTREHTPTPFSPGLEARVGLSSDKVAHAVTSLLTKEHR